MFLQWTKKFPGLMKLSECRPTVGRGCWLGAPGRRFSRCGQWSGSESHQVGRSLVVILNLKRTDGHTDGQSWLRSEPTNNYPPNINPLPGWTGRKVKPSRVKYQLWSHLNSEVWQGWDWVELPQTLQNCCSIRKVLDWVLVDIFGLF